MTTYVLILWLATGAMTGKGPYSEAQCAIYAQSAVAMGFATQAQCARSVSM
jgi:hypothetical protein